MKYLKRFENYFENNTKLDISVQGLVDFPDEFLPLNNNLRKIWCDENNLTELPELPLNLIELDCSLNKNLTKFPILPDGLENLYCNNNNLTELPKLPNNLIILKCFGNNLTELPEFPKSLTRYNFSNNNWIKPIYYKIFIKSEKYYWDRNKNRNNNFYTKEQKEKFTSYEFQKSFMEETPFEWKDLDVFELGLHDKIKEEFDFILNYDSYKID